MDSIEIQFETVTPLFMSGANREKVEFRLPSLKGALRFWWRAIAYSNYNGELSAIRKREASIFGSAQQWLTDALIHCGAGAKTAVGYGRFELTEERNPGEVWLTQLCKDHDLDPDDIENVSTIAKHWETIPDENVRSEVCRLMKVHIGDQSWNKPLGRSIKKAINKLKDYLASRED